MNWATLREDLRLIPAFARLLPALYRLAREDGGNAATRLCDLAEHQPARPCLRFEHGALTYADFNGLVNAFAAVLRQAGVGREPFALVMENGPNLLAAQLAAAKTGAVAALIPPQLSGAALSLALRQSGARHVFTDATCLPRVVAPPESASLTLWGQGDPALIPPHVEPLDAALAAAPRHEPPPVTVRPDDVFLYLYAAAAGGVAKPALVQHRRFRLVGTGLSRLLGLNAEDVIYAPLPLFEGAGNLLGFNLALHAGACFASRRMPQADIGLAEARRHGATVLVYTGDLCRRWLRQPAGPGERDHHLRLAVGSGLPADLWPSFVERFAIPRVVETYGAAEGNLQLINLAGRPGSVGRALPLRHGAARLARCDVDSGRLERDQHGFAIACADGEVGELLGRITPREWLPYAGYVDRQATEARIARNVFRHGDAYFRSGDRMRRDADGYFTFVDRAGDSLRWHGASVSSAEVGDVLRNIPGIAEVYVYGVEVAGCDGRAGMAALVLNDGPFDADACYRAVQLLAPYAQPAFVRLAPAGEVGDDGASRQRIWQREGYDLDRIADPVYVRDDRGKSFVRLTRAIAAIAGGPQWPL